MFRASFTRLFPSSLRNGCRCCAGFLFILVLVLSTVLPLRAATITLAADLWCPYNCRPGNDRPGYVVELAQKIFAPAGITVKYQLMNWSRAILMARRGKISGIIGAAVAEAPDLVFPVEPVGVSVNSFWTTRKSSWRYAGPDSLDGLQVGVVKGYDYGDELNAYLDRGRNSHVRFVGGEHAIEKIIQALDTGRIDVVIDDESVFRYTAENLGKMADFRLAGKEAPQSDDYVFIAFSPRDPRAGEYAQMFTRGIRRLRSSGELDTLLARYGLQDWQSGSHQPFPGRH